MLAFVCVNKSNNVSFEQHCAVSNGARVVLVLCIFAKSTETKDKDVSQ
jgi:hypothetical protein